MKKAPIKAEELIQEEAEQTTAIATRRSNTKFRRSLDEVLRFYMRYADFGGLKGEGTCTTNFDDKTKECWIEFEITPAKSLGERHSAE